MRWPLLLTLVLGLLTIPYFFVSNLEDAENPAIELAGPEETVFDWTEDACEMQDYPDSPARAFRDQSGKVRLLTPHFNNRFMVGPSLNKLQRRCALVMSSGLDPAPANFDDKEWIAATYTRDGGTVFALIHHEYQGNTHPGRCPSGDYPKCWYNSITLAMSRDGGATFTHLRPPSHLVASVPYRYQPDAGPYGLFQPSNIVLNPKDGFFYVFVRAERFGKQRYGSCLLRTRRLRDPGSWRAWDGSGFNVRFLNPYRASESSRSNHVCTPVASDRIAAMTDSLTYSTLYKKFLLIGPAAGPGIRGGAPTWGIYYSLSEDLLNWSPRKLIAEVEFLWTYRCGDRSPVLYPSVIDPDSRSRNFLTVDERAYLYFVRFHYTDCKITADRDLVRIPIRFSK